jgi:hypothetical protein
MNTLQPSYSYACSLAADRRLLQHATESSSKLTLSSSLADASWSLSCGMVWYGMVGIERHSSSLPVAGGGSSRRVAITKPDRSSLPPNNSNPIGRHRISEETSTHHTTPHPLIVLTKMPPPIVRRRDDAFLLSFQTNYETIAVVDEPPRDLITIALRRSALDVSRSPDTKETEGFRTTTTTRHV